MKRFLIILLYFILLFVYITSAFAKGLNTGADVAQGSLLREQAIVNYIKDNGLYSGDELSPNKIVTRSEVACVVSRAVGLASVETEITYADVKKNHTYYREIVAISEAGIMTGTDACFRPDDFITREEFAVVIDRVYSAYFEDFPASYEFYPERFVDSADVWWG